MRLKLICIYVLGLRLLKQLSLCADNYEPVIDRLDVTESTTSPHDKMKVYPHSRAGVD